MTWDLRIRSNAGTATSWSAGFTASRSAGPFSAKACFPRATDASKIALCHLAARLRKSGFVLLDSQFVTDHLRQFGTEEIDRAAYKSRLAEALKVNADFQPELSDDELAAFIQSTTQTS